MLLKSRQLITNAKRRFAGVLVCVVLAGLVTTGLQAAATPGIDREAATGSHEFNGAYTGDYLSRVAFPMGGMGAGMICMEGTGTLSHVSLRNRPEVYNEPYIYSAVCIKGKKGNVARVLEGPLPGWKLFGIPGSGNGLGGRTYGLPRFGKASFKARFPFGMVQLSDDQMPLDVTITGWSPFTPGDPDNSSLPVAALEFHFVNRTWKTVEAVYSFNAKNFMEAGGKPYIHKADRGFIFGQEPSKDKPWEKGDFYARVTDPEAKVNCAWFRGGWFDSNTMAWENVKQGKAFDRPSVSEGGQAPGASIYVPFRLTANQEKTIVLQLSWYVPQTNMRIGEDAKNNNKKQQEIASCEGGKCKIPQHYKPWYSSKFEDIYDVMEYWDHHYQGLRDRSRLFRECFYDSTLPAEVIEAVAANLTILKAPTVLRQHDGRLWCFEGCCDSRGCCHGSCTHVWNYAQAMPHLFPSLERTLRETEYFVSQDERGHQAFRTALPIRPTTHNFHAASDGQLGGIMKVHREWRISGDNDWLKKIWPKVKQSMDYCSQTWDPKSKGILEEPHHNTYDIEFWGPEPMCTSFYLGALKAACKMGEALGEDVSKYQELLEKGQAFVNEQLWNGAYFYQKIQWEGLKAPNPTKVQSFHGGYSPEALELLKKEGPKYQYGKGCLSDGVLGVWIAEVCGVGPVLNQEKVAGHLESIHKYNLKHDLSDHVNPQRPTFAADRDGGLLLCTWPKGGKLSLPFVYSNEVWTGIEYQVAAHLIMKGMVEKGLDIVRTARERYDGVIRNPFNEYECGHWYARAMSSYALLQALSGARYDAVEKTLYLEPQIKGDFRSFLSTATGFGTVGVKGGKPFVDVVHGKIDLEKIEYAPAD